MQRHIRRLTLPVTTLAIAVLSTGCGGLTERTVESALDRIDGVEDVDISRSGEGFAIRTEEGSMTMDGSSGQVTLETDDGTVQSGAATEAPDAIASRLALPATFEVTNATEAKDGEGGQTSAVGGVLRDTTMSDALDDLAQAIGSAGLTIAVRSESAELSHLSTEEPDGDTGTMVAVVLIGDGEDVTVQLTLTERR